MLTVLVDGALDDAHHAPQRIGVIAMRACLAHVEQGDALARRGVLHFGVRVGVVATVPGTFAAGIPLDDVVNRRLRIVGLVVGFDTAMFSRVSLPPSRRTSSGARVRRRAFSSTRSRNAGVPF